MELSLSNWVFCRLPLHLSVGKVAELGFKNIEFNPKCIEFEADESVDRAGELISLKGLTCLSVHSADIYVKKPSQVEEALRYGKASINLAKRLSSPVLVVHSYVSRELSEKLRNEVLSEVFGRLEDHASESGVELALENLSTYSKGYGRSYSEVEDILQATGSRRMGITLDFCHSERIGQTFKFLEEFKTRLRNVHISSYMHGPVGDTPELEAFLKGLKRVNYAGPLTVEISPKHGEEGVVKTKLSVEKILQKI